MKPLLISLVRMMPAAVLFFACASAQDTAPSAHDLAARLSDKIQNGSAILRLKMDVTKAGGGKTAYQIRVKSRRAKGATDLVYQILWPKESKGVSLLLRKSGGGAPGGALFTPPDSMVTLTAANMRDAIFGSDLSYDDLLDNFFTWEKQAIVGTETVDRVPCQILESKPGKADGSGYAKVRSWIDPKRMVTLRVEKYTAAGKVAKRIDTTQVTKDDTGNMVGSGYSLRRPGQDSVTEIEGSNSSHGVIFTAGDFTPEALRTLK